MLVKIWDMRIGYARVSIEDQTMDLQRDALKQARCREVYEDHATGKNTVRQQLEACLKSVREGDALVVWRLDRLGRNLSDLVRLVAELEHQMRSLDFRRLHRWDSLCYHSRLSIVRRGVRLVEWPAIAQ